MLRSIGGDAVKRESDPNRLEEDERKKRHLILIFSDTMRVGDRWFRSLETYATLVRISKTVWLDAESDLQDGQPVLRNQQGTFDPPHAGQSNRTSIFFRLFLANAAD